MFKTTLLCFLFLSIASVTFSQSGVSIGDPAPELSVDEWLKGDPVTSFESGTVYLVEFWGTWCGPCIKNIPHLSDLQKKYASKGLVVIGVATHEFDGREKLDKFMKDRGDEMEYLVAYDTDLSMQKDWDTGKKEGDDFRLPVCFLVDRSGKVIFEGHPSDEKLEKVIADAVEE